MGKYRVSEHEFKDAYGFWLEDDEIAENLVLMFLQQLGVEVGVVR